MYGAEKKGVGQTVTWPQSLANTYAGTASPLKRDVNEIRHEYWDVSSAYGNDRTCALIVVQFSSGIIPIFDAYISNYFTEYK